MTREPCSRPSYCLKLCTDMALQAALSTEGGELIIDDLRNELDEKMAQLKDDLLERCQGAFGQMIENISAILEQKFNEAQGGPPVNKN